MRSNRLTSEPQPHFQSALICTLKCMSTHLMILFEISQRALTDKSAPRQFSKLIGTNGEDNSENDEEGEIAELHPIATPAPLVFATIETVGSNHSSGGSSCSVQFFLLRGRWALGI